MNKEHTLIIGAGPAAIQTAVLVANGWRSKVSILNRNDSYSRSVQNHLEQKGRVIKSIAENRPFLSGQVQISHFYNGYSDVNNQFDTIILSVPSYSYKEVIHQLKLDNLKKVTTIILLSAGFGSNREVKNLVDEVNREIEVISLSTYYAATKFKLVDDVLFAYTKAVKKRVYLATSNNGGEIDSVKGLLEDAGIRTVVMENSINAECRNITTYVHPPFFINEFSMNEILAEEPSVKSLYKLYPEGPITQETVRIMVKLWKEISALVKELGGEPINLLQFLNDDNYPVHEVSLSRSDIDDFPVLDTVKQEYLLYIRYSSILIDPFSEPDESGAYFDFSKVPYKQVTQMVNGDWIIPRIPLEDYKNLLMIYQVGKESGISMPQTLMLIKLFERKVKNWQVLKGGVVRDLELHTMGERNTFA
ncbi:opine metallophore biosynthesis dehydrogenase [Bacillus sp. NTK071]|uniref:opine metallophore biosynthesis dehydrogenase n=1 Tax=Bacillus sp. NTK071 TaxID=2802175 RepID=UPI001A8D8F68|nr:opine metallophore biosynthesis dehydrogenase [Bacillus sp. NTK071]